MSSRLSFEICRALTQLTRQLLEAGKHETQTHVLAKGQLYRVVVSLEPVPTEQLQDVINRYL
ncbi:hypothetical protein [Billgrantia gudaonensis]|uniref:Uncharacterized protein n=1 Tax=Billgrantia gudaonensis TaxID=376427 RepID=A0A1G8Y8Q8_9GAMM|nr:hypothetical protein [Halomonas gudaonensis]SDJ98605.1 hypothetical protein SAMN04487954_11022 [Halomonas gudaonensis]